MSLFMPDDDGGARWVLGQQLVLGVGPGQQPVLLPGVDAGDALPVVRGGRSGGGGLGGTAGPGVGLLLLGLRLALVDELHGELHLPPLGPVGRVPVGGRDNSLQNLINFLGILLPQFFQLGCNLLLSGSKSRHGWRGSVGRH